MSDHLPFKVEYVRTSKTTCKKCGQPIAKDSLRIAKVVSSYRVGKKEWNWFDEKCFWEEAQVRAADDIENFQHISPEDQEKINKKIESSADVLPDFERLSIGDNAESTLKSPGTAKRELLDLLKESRVESTLEKPVQDLIRLIFDVENIMKAREEYQLDTENLPLGALSKDQLLRGYAVLKEVENLLASDQPEIDQLREATNRFYREIPQSGSENPSILDNDDIVKEKLDMLDALMEMENVYRFLRATPDETINPLDLLYRNLNAEIHVLDRKSKEFKIIEKYTKNTHGITHRGFELSIEEVFVVHRQGEDERYERWRRSRAECFYEDHMLLWHGSRTTNYAGILSEGLKIAPPEAPSTGYLFGRGIYLADRVSKAAQYCGTKRRIPTGLLLLCQYLPGRKYQPQTAENVEKNLSDRYQSVFARGEIQPDINHCACINDAYVPCGRGVGKPSCDSQNLIYNEYVAFHVEQIKIRYLVRMNFKYK